MAQGADARHRHDEQPGQARDNIDTQAHEQERPRRHDQAQDDPQGAKRRDDARGAPEEPLRGRGARVGPIHAKVIEHGGDERRPREFEQQSVWHRRPLP